MVVIFYRLTHHEKTVYIGSTKKTLEERMYQHFSIAPHRPRCKLYKAIVADPTGWKILKLSEKEGIDNHKAARKVIEDRLKAKFKNPVYNERNGLC